MKLSLVTVCLNAERCIDSCLQSVADQVFDGEIEHVIQDGQSQDGTLRRIRDFPLANTTWNRVLSSESDDGIYDALNRAIEKTTGQIIGILHSDDRLHDPGILQKITDGFDNRSLDLLYGDLEYRSERGELTRIWRAGAFRYSKLTNGWMPPHPAVFFTRELWDRAGPFRLDMGTAADYEWLLRVFLRRDLRWKYLPTTLITMTPGGASSDSIGTRLSANRMDRKAWDLNNKTPGLGFAVLKPFRKLFQYRPGYFRHMFRGAGSGKK